MNDSGPANNNDSIQKKNGNEESEKSDANSNREESRRNISGRSETPSTFRSGRRSGLNSSSSRQFANNLAVVRRNSVSPLPLLTPVPLSPRSPFQPEQRQYFHYQRSSSGPNNGFYSCGGYSDSRGQRVYFNCLTTSPVAVQLTNRGINMDVPNGFGGGNRQCQGGGYNNPHQLRHHHHANPSGPSASQTVNHGASIFNFYFVNSGQYDLSFTGNGLPGVGGQAQQAATPMPQAPAQQGFNNNPMGGMFSVANPFPQGHAHANSSMFSSNFSNGRNVSSASPARPNGHEAIVLPQAPGVPGTPYYPGPGVRPMNSTVGGFHSFAQGNGAFAPVGNPHAPGIPYNNYRDCGHAYRTMSQGSLENYEDLYEEEQDYTCGSQCSVKSQSFGGGPSHFNGNGHQ